MKKFSAIVATAALVLSLTACGGASDAGTPATDASNTGVDAAADNTADAGDATVNTDTTDDGAQNVDADADMEGVMTYAEYAAADVDTEVTVITYVQDKQGWWENEGVGNATFYTQDKDGAYFLYNMPCSQEDYDAMVPGTKIKVTGFKSEWSGEVEIVDATYEILGGDTYIATAADVTDKISDNDALAAYMNQYVTFTGLTVAEREGAAFTYGWDGSKSQGDDIYFNLADAEGNVYTFVVESYLRGADTDTYKAVEAFNVGDTVDVTGFMYWYEGPQVHVTIATVK